VFRDSPCKNAMMCCSDASCLRDEVAVCCRVLQYVAVWCSMLQCVAVCCSVLQCILACSSVFQHVTACYSVAVAVCSGQLV